MTNHIKLLRTALEEMLDPHDGSECRFDHDRFCQEHVSSEPCFVAQAREALAATDELPPRVWIDFVQDPEDEERTRTSVGSSFDDELMTAHLGFACVALLQMMEDNCIAGGVDPHKIRLINGTRTAMEKIMGIYQPPNTPRIVKPPGAVQ